MSSVVRFLVSVFLVLSVAVGIAVVPADAQNATPESSPVIVDPAMVAGFGTAQGNFARTGDLDVAGPQGNPVLRWQSTLPAGAFSAPISSEGMTFVTTEGPLVAVDLVSGEIVWTLDQPEGTASAPTLVDGVLYQGT
jgi:outer membrane protein assembly factor BamB